MITYINLLINLNFRWVENHKNYVVIKLLLQLPSMSWTLSNKNNNNILDISRH